MNVFLYHYDIINNEVSKKIIMETLKEDVKNYIIQQLNDEVGLDNDVSDLHHYLLNEDYFIIGSYRAEQWLKKIVFLMLLKK